MKQLSSFSIETDQMVQLIFADGSQYRVKKHDLSSLLSARDFKKVMTGFKTRKKFFNETLPPWARVVTIAIIAITVGAGSMRAYSYVMQHVAPKPVSHAPAPVADASNSSSNPKVLAATTASAGKPAATQDNNSSATRQDVPGPSDIKAETSPPANRATAAVHASTNSPVQLKVAVPAPVPVVQSAVKQVSKTVKGMLGGLGL